jgi:hypothetical protein
MVLTALAMSIFYFQQQFPTVGILSGYTHVVPPYAPMILSGIWLAGMVFCVVAYYWSKSKGENLTQNWYTLGYAFLLSSGVASMTFTILQSVAEMRPILPIVEAVHDVTTLEYLQGPVGIVPTLLAFYYRRSMYGFLGERWAKQRMKDGTVHEIRVLYTIPPVITLCLPVSPFSPFANRRSTCIFAGSEL